MTLVFFRDCSCVLVSFITSTVKDYGEIVVYFHFVDYQHPLLRIVIGFLNEDNNNTFCSGLISYRSYLNLKYNHITFKQLIISDKTKNSNYM